MGRGTSKVGSGGGGGAKAVISDTKSIIKSMNEEPLGTTFYFENGAVVLKTQDDYGFSGTLPMYQTTMPDGRRIGYWGKWGAKRDGNMSDKFTNIIKDFGSVIKIEHGKDPYRRTPDFT